MTFIFFRYKSNRKFIALNVYIALCYYKLDYYDVSEEVLASYLQAHPDSPIALNLRACNYFRQYDGRGAEKELKNIKNPQGNMSALVKHNQVVFRNGEGALQVFPPLVGVLPEARLNLAIHHLRNGEIAEAHQLMRDVEPAQSPEYILKVLPNNGCKQRYLILHIIFYCTKNLGYRSSFTWSDGAIEGAYENSSTVLSGLSQDT